MVGHWSIRLPPSRPAYATQVRLFQHQLAKHLNTALGRPAVRTIRVLAPRGGTPAADTTPEPEPAKPSDAPVKTRETASPGYRATLEAVFAHRPDRQPTHPYVGEAAARQEAAMRAHRQPEGEHRDGVWEVDRLTTGQPDPADAIRRAALARARHERGGGVPRRLFGAA